MTYTKSSVCVIEELTCMGCCGNHFTTKEEIMEAVKKNTLEYNSINDKIKFRDRNKKDLVRGCGVCNNIIYQDKDMKKIMCPLHPYFNNEEEKKDIRENHCDIHYLCKTAFIFSIWNKDKQDKFIQFIKEKKLDWFDFSMGMDKGLFLKEFEYLNM
jgi:hypothetical protein